MTEKSTINLKAPEFLREPIESAQAKLAEFEKEAQKVIEDLVQRLPQPEWNLAELKAIATEKLAELRAKVIALLGIATREQVRELSKALAQLARRLDKVEKTGKTEKVTKPRNGAKRPAAEA